MNEEFYNRHYITIRSDGAITDAWSDGPHPENDTANAVCINKQGGYQFQLFGVENPPLHDMDGIPLYKWDWERVVPRSEEEIKADRGAIPIPPPSTQEQLRADVDFIAAMTNIVLT